MRAFKTLYNAISILLMTVQIGFLAILIYNKITIGRVLYYGNKDESNIGFEKYFKILQAFLYSSLILIIAWSLLTPLALFSNKKGLEKDKVDIYVGSAGFITAIILLIIDPFGIFKWFTD
jgi:hypothetical protein